jgi:acetoacetyl-CoA reductase
LRAQTRNGDDKKILEDVMSRVALVTGGTRGIGHAICAQLKRDGYKVAAGYSGNEDAAKATAKELDVFIVKGNVGQFEDCKRVAPEDWYEVIRVNMHSVFNMTRQVIDGMRDRGWGRIINISSINGQKGQMGQTNYSAAKAGMIGFTKALAMENARKGITVNCIAPGYTDTEMVHGVPPKVLESIVAGIPVGRLGKPEEIAGAVSFLVSEQGAWITGSTIAINGGQYMP